MRRLAMPAKFEQHARFLAPGGRELRTSPEDCKAARGADQHEFGHVGLRSAEVFGGAGA